MKFVENLHKLILVTLSFIFAKNILQIFFGIVSNSPNKQYDSLILINPSNFTGSTLEFYFFYFFLYEILIIGSTAYLLLYIALFFITKKLGNSLWLQILYLLLAYFIATIFYNTTINFFFIPISIILGVLNWNIFKRYIK